MVRKMRRLLGLVLLVSVLLARPAAAQEIGVKSLAGPPEEFAARALPTGPQAAVPSAVLLVDGGQRQNVGKGGALAVDVSNFETTPGVGFTLLQVTSQYPRFRPATLTAPDGRRYEFDGARMTCNFTRCGEYQAGLSLEAFVQQAPGGAAAFSISGGEVQGGVWQLTLQDPIGEPLLDGPLPEVETLLTFDDNVVQVEIEPDPCRATSLCFNPARAGKAFDLVDGAAPVLAVSFSNKKARERKAAAAPALTLSALTVTVTEVDSRVRVHQEVYRADRVAGLAKNAARSSLVQLPPLAPGRYSVRLDVAGEVAGVGRVQRTAFLFLPILERTHRLTGEVSTHVMDAERLEIELGVETLLPEAGHLYAYAEVWAAGGAKPVAWIGGMTHPKPGSTGGSVLPLVLDGRWLALAGVTAGNLELRNLRVHDPDSFLPLDQLDRLPVTVTELPRAAALARTQVIKDDSLYQGKGDITIPTDVEPVDRGRGGPFDQGILLVHGFCSGFVWPVADFNVGGRVGDTAVFDDRNQSRSHDAFARRIREQGDALFPSNFTVVAHSQGGAAATHLRAFYNSNLDLSNAPRRIQTMGTPYGGSTLMDLYIAIPLLWGFAEAVGSCFPPQFDLTTLGSRIWQATLPWWVRDDVFYHQTTHNLPRNFWQALQFWRWNCGFASYLIVGPDDGVVSLPQGLFLGGHAQTPGVGECHVRNPAQTDNPGRNDIMDREGRPAPVPPPTLQAACAVERIFHSSGHPIGGGSYWEYFVNAGGSTPGAFPIASYTWTINGAAGVPGTQVRIGPFLPGFPGQASNYWVTVTVRDTSGASAGATCAVP